MQVPREHTLGRGTKYEMDTETVRSAETLTVLDSSDVLSLGDSSMGTLADASSLSGDPEAWGARSEDIRGLTRENAELRRHIKRRTEALDRMRKAYIVDVENLKKKMRDQAEGTSTLELEQGSLEGIPSLDFRPVLQLYAPEDAKLQISPCDECGGTMEIIHYNDKAMLKLQTQVQNLHEQLTKVGNELRCSNALVETYRSKEGTLEVEFSHVKGAMIKEMLSLKQKLADAGPEVLAQVSEARDRAEARLRATHGRVAELETVYAKSKKELDQVAADNIQVEEMEHHLREAFREVKRVTAQRDQQAVVTDELRATAAYMKNSLREAIDAQAELRKALKEEQENALQSNKKLRTLLNNSQARELTLRDEVAVLREEQEATRSDYEGGNDAYDSQGYYHADQDSKKYQCLEVDAASPRRDTMSPRGRHSGIPEADLLKAGHGESDRMSFPDTNDKELMLELAETLRQREQELNGLKDELAKERNDKKKLVDQHRMELELGASGKRAGELVSAVEDMQEVRVSQEAEGLRILLEEAQTKANKEEQEKKKILSMWNAAKKLSSNADSTFSNSGESATPHANKEAWSDDSPPSSPVQLPMPSKAYNKDEDANGFSANAITASDDMDEAEDVLVNTVQPLEDDRRELLMDKEQLQEYCASLKTQTNQLEEHVARAESEIKRKTIAKGASDRDLKEQRELLSKATLEIAEQSAVLSDAQDAAETAQEQLQFEREQVRSEREKVAKIKKMIQEMASLNGVLEAGLKATKIALDASVKAKREAEITAKRNAARAESEGMRAEEGLTRCYLFEVTSAEQMAVIRAELGDCQAELVRRRQEAKEHAEEMEAFRAVLAERARLEMDVSRQQEQIAKMQQKSASDQAVIEEFKLQVALLDAMRREVLTMEEKLEKTQRDLAKTKTKLDATREENKLAERDLREKTILSRALWSALTGVLVIVDDWCSGPLLAWRNANGSEGKPSTSLKPPIAPFEARGVDGIMHSRHREDAGVKASTSGSNGSVETEPEKPLHEQLQGQRPKALKAWMDFRVHVVAQAEHNKRVDGAFEERLLMDAACKQRTAQILNMEELVRQVEAKNASLERGYSELLVVKEELTDTIVEQNETLLDNSRELNKYEILKVEHQAEVQQHREAAKQLENSEKHVEELISRVEAELAATKVAQLTAKEAEYVRHAAVGQREEAQRKANLLKEKMEGAKWHTASVEAKLQEILDADELRLKTNTSVATEVAYGELTSEACTQTTFLCPELTMRQLTQKRAVRGVPQETVGRVHPALGGPDGRCGSNQKLGPLLWRAGAGGGGPAWEGMVGVNGGTKRRKQGPRGKESYATTRNMLGQWLPSWRCGSEMAVGVTTRVETPVEVVIHMTPEAPRAPQLDRRNVSWMLVSAESGPTQGGIPPAEEHFGTPDSDGSQGDSWCVAWNGVKGNEWDGGNSDGRHDASIVSLPEITS